ncbi:MAG: T9SS type A sorting domain-containing protein [Saprospiraceae bacterium]|nr:T9SS type A sorting domain-containing protein [Saprospiraceae bacterium]
MRQLENPPSENIIVSINGQNKTIYHGNAKDGNACVEFIVLANGTANNGIWAKFQYTTSCQDEDKYHTPYACVPPPPCELDIYKVEVSECYFDHNDYKSKAKVKICVSWKYAPNENIIVSINGQNKTIYTNGNASGNACVEFIVLANGTANNGIWAKFQYTTSCQDEDKYHTPYACVPPPPCELDIYKVEVSECYFDHNDYKSKAKVKICVSWKYAPNENIIVSINGQNKTIYTNGNASGNACVEFIVLANGTSNNGIWAKFQYTTSCQDEDKYHTPYACVPPPPCELDIYKVEVGQCYFDHNDYKSKVKVKVCVSWKYAPPGEKIFVLISGQYRHIVPNYTTGSTCVEFVVPADGSQYNGIWARFEYDDSCQDEAFYNSPYGCVPTPECELDIYKVEVGECYYEDGQARARLKVCVSWKYAPNENIIVSINGQNKTVYTNGNASGNACVEFIVPANGTNNNGIWAKFQYKTSCQDEDKYHTPYPCQPVPQCAIDIKKVEVSECSADPTTGKSTATLKVCVAWNNAPAGNKIVVSINGQNKSFVPSGNSGEYCVYFTVPADGSANNGIWAKFDLTPICNDEAFYKAPQSCLPLACDCNFDYRRDTIVVKFSADCKSVCICSTKDISNLVFDFGDGCFQNFNTDIKKEAGDLTGSLKKQFFYFNQPINGIWVKAGNNKCSDVPETRGCTDGSGVACCPGCGEYFECGDPDNWSRTAVESSDVEEAVVLPLFEDAKVKTLDITLPKEVKVFPNPTTDELYVELGGFKGRAAHIQIFNTVGQLMSQVEIDKVGEEATRLDVSKLTSDMYFLKVYVPNEGVFTQKFIVRKQ